MNEASGEQQAFLEFTAQDRGNLLRLAPLLEENADAFVEAFYRHLLAFPPTRHLLRDPAVKNRLLGRQREYLLSLSDPSLDESYMAERRQIGLKHVQVGLEPRWYLGAYTLYLKLLIPLIFDSFKSDPSFGPRALMSLIKVLTFDSQLAMEAYISRREEELEYLNRELGEASRGLEARYDEQSVELAATSARAQAAEQLASVATVVAGLAHEIGTPMGVIQGHAELLESSVTDEKGRKRLSTIREQIERISHIIQTLLNMARPHTPERTLVELGRIIEDTLAFLGEKFLRRNLHVVTLFDVRASLIGSGERLQQLFLNLLINAADAMVDGGELRITLRPAPEDDSAVEVVVRDTGQGIPDDILERVFEPFFTTKAAGRGSGLGLMVARGIVVDHGGTIDVKSRVGDGTEIRIVLPCKEIVAQA